jgi:transcriptional adapter 2-alpha
LDYRKNSAIDKKRSKEERDLLNNRIRCFAKLMTPSDFEEFSNSLVLELQCRRRIALLQEYRQNGIRDFETAVKYEKDKAVRYNALARSQGITVTAPPPAPPLTSSTVEALQKAKYNVRSSGNIMNGGAVTNKPLKKSFPPTLTPLDISHSADVDLLSYEEQALCSQLRIHPKPYLTIKETLFRELLKNGGNLKKKNAKEILKIDVNKATRIYEFFQAQHWIN